MHFRSNGEFLNPVPATTRLCDGDAEGKSLRRVTYTVGLSNTGSAVLYSCHQKSAYSKGILYANT